MAARFIDVRNLRFLLYDVLDVESLTRYPMFEDHSRETFDLVVDTAMRMASELLHPILQEMDRVPPELVDGTVRVHPKLKAFIREAGDGGWIGASFPEEHGGQQIPLTVFAAYRFALAAANYSASVFPFLTTGAAHLVLSFGSEELIERYTPPMLDGRWQGTMALTEPQAGSSLADITTRAEPTDDGYYRITGQKIFISAGDHDAVENVIHLMLARIKGGPAGIKGISLFAVPKKRIGPDESLVDNDVACATLYHKMGYRGTPLTQLSLGENGDCRGELVGEPHQGLKYMFQMMNEARIDVGLGATAIASAAYHAALEYARERPQGRRITERDPEKPQIPIIEHADVKRMLLFQRSVTEGALSLILQLSLYADLIAVTEGDERDRYQTLLDLLTPVAKSYPSEMGILSTSQALQCLGGYGYCDEFPVEQHFRDMRIHPIHEGTTGIQALDLLGRKIVRNGGQAAFTYAEEVRKVIARAREHEPLKTQAEELDAALERLSQVTASLGAMALEGKIEEFLADATVYLEYFGIIAIGWQWLSQAVVAHQALQNNVTEDRANFLSGKLHTFQYYFAYELPRSEGLARILTKTSGLTVSMKPEYFGDPE